MKNSLFFQGDCDNVTKLEKADILELTVRHLHSLRRQNKLYATASVAYADRFRAGFTHCAAEVSQFLNKIDQNANAHLMRHLRDCIQRCEPTPPPPPPPPSTPILRMSSASAPPTTLVDGAAHFYGSPLSKLNQIPKVAADATSNINNNYLTSGYNSDNNEPDNRPVLIKQSISPPMMMMMMMKDDPQQGGDVWRPW